MIIQLLEDISASLKVETLNKINEFGFKTTEVKTQKASYLVCIGKSETDIRKIGNLSGVRDVHVVKESYQLVSRQWKVNTTTLDLGDKIEIGNGTLALMAGPCSLESEEQIRLIVDHLIKNNVRIMRGGAFKPRTSPYAFRGLGLEGLKLFHSICRENGIKVITEVMEISQIEPMYDFVDVYQVGARNSQNFSLLDELGRIDKPILIKRAMSGTIEELLQSAEYVFSKGNERLMLCERGIRTYENAYRNTFDINAIPILKEKSHLPVIADPSHGIGIRQFVPQIALASALSGADGVIYEVHHTPEEALSDGQQTLDFSESGKLIHDLRLIEKVRMQLN